MKKRTLKDRIMFMALAIGLGIGSVVAPAIAVAQSSGSSGELTTNGSASLGNGPAFNVAVQGESASTVQGTFLNVVNIICNWFCPVAGGIAVVHAIFAARSGSKWLPSAATALCFFLVSGIVRMIESLVVSGNSGLTN